MTTTTTEPTNWVERYEALEGQRKELEVDYEVACAAFESSEAVIKQLQAENQRLREVAEAARSIPACVQMNGSIREDHSCLDALNQALARLDGAAAAEGEQRSG